MSFYASPGVLVPVQKVPRVGTVGEDKDPNNPTVEFNGTGHMGVSSLDRVIMSLRSGIELEIAYALSTLSFYTCNEPSVILFQNYPYIGEELIRHFIKPYRMFAQDPSSLQDVDSTILSSSVEALLSLRNAVQDLPNQQWLCQVSQFREQALTALRFFNGWFYLNSFPQNYALTERNDLFRESLHYLLDILDALTCFYVENRLNDPLFAQFLVLFANTDDKHVLMTTIKCIHHQLFLGGADALAPRDPMLSNADNCIDAIKPEHLKKIVPLLFVNDDDLNAVVLGFIKQYLFSEAVHPNYHTSVSKSQFHRLQLLTQATGSKSNLKVLLKQLPELIVAKLPLVDASLTNQPVPLQLALRAIDTVPAVTSRLPRKLYDIIITFPEPLRATTWLRCCYESFNAPPSQLPAESNEAVPGEVTQISLWKAYENQFEAIWKDRLNPNWPNLLPAVDFIKNVSTAFPNSEAMVVSVPTTDPTQPGKKKFIIKGIQPRIHPVNIDVANFEALTRGPPANPNLNAASTSVGDVDNYAFERALKKFTNSILYASDGLPGPEDTEAPWYSPINVLSRDILGKIVDELLEPDTDGEYKNIFRQSNKDWLPELVFYNPGLVERNYIDGKWLQYLL
ncbi:hypothetical protein PUMCH_002877 [Australozyma saopauloensis]|uniref:RFX-type winged-helix domain-containing protein n=1 Tax=Australozyma saopauloensis TaxID=291208 RepID=A0AAX4HCD6_9ASCO|nr:hypothetical protein PUMCH_002877 [[Candida] saopauloensis]